MTIKHADELAHRLAQLYARTDETPLFNPAMQLGFELSRDIEAGTLTSEDRSDLVGEFEDWAFRHRANRLGGVLGPLAADENLAQVRQAATQVAVTQDFAHYQRRFAQQLMGCVFTAHPTFMMPKEGYQALAQCAETGGETFPAFQAVAPTLDEEHSAVLTAIDMATQAQAQIADVLIETAQTHFPADWRRFRPSAFRFATWVGYDMDGRTDIAWHTSLAYRLIEKQRQLQNYVDEVIALSKATDLLDDVLSRLQRALDHTDALVAKLEAFNADACSLTDLGDAISEDHPDRLLSLDPMLSTIDALIEDAPEDVAKSLIRLASTMRVRRLGLGTVHFRINASQLNNAIRRYIGADEGLSMSSRAAFSKLRERLGEARPIRTNLAALANEATTAVRQFLAMAQFLKHIDADSHIRLLIAECEQPATVLCALYFAKLFGIDAKVQVSPLFETEAALEHGARFLDALLAEPHYQRYARQIGCVAIQTGFSDAGRFLGQVPAALAIERLQGRLAQLMAAHDLRDVEAIIFNTHGESMGRGAHPLSIAARIDHAMSPWARAQFFAAGIALRSEVSFQGGDGYVMFGSPALSLATLTRLFSHLVGTMEGDGDDPFYKDVDLSLDFYRDVRRFQRDMFTDRDYNLALLGFGLSLLNPTGSRRSVRQSDLGADGRPSLRRVRAIPHNAVLQQLGYPVNVIAGVGQATDAQREQFANLVAQSKRAQSLLSLVGHASRRASIKTLVAYGELFNGAFWATRPYRGAEPELESACLELAEKLTSDQRTPAFRRLATKLRVDGLKLRRLVDLVPSGIVPKADEDFRRRLGAMHGLRLALMQHIFLKAAQVPAFSKRNDVGRDEVLDMVLSLRIDDALERYRTAYPLRQPQSTGDAMEEASDYPLFDAPDYARIRKDYIDEIETAFALIRRLSTAIAHCFGAHG